MLTVRLPNNLMNVITWPKEFVKWMETTKFRLRSLKSTIEKCMLTEARVAAGLGNPPMNLVIKEQINNNAVDMVRTSRPEVFCKKGVLRNFVKFTGKHLCQSFFFNKVAGLRPATLLKKKLWHRCFLVNFVRFLRAPFL